MGCLEPRYYERGLQRGIIAPVLLDSGLVISTKEEHAVIYMGMDVHQVATTFCLFDPSKEKAGRYRTVTRPATAEGIREVPAPFERVPHPSPLRRRVGDGP